ncbi:hypothetical protein HU200_005271 [Digitaria exilis]|uniref:Cyanobacterial aminoacyl-tRNA synthetase CAAD domain-containing protein n=1 Tax=Digitaria exilis TaxID=1010633 RepID=A0A835KUD5_9POAL|nr:hypothetical protein HU200_005271 [Digitaria exilis]
MVAATAAARPVPVRRPGALLRSPVPCGLPASRVAAPFPRRTGTGWPSSFDVHLMRLYASKWDGQQWLQTDVINHNCDLLYISESNKISSTASLKIYQLQLTARRFPKKSNSSEDDDLLSELRDKWDAMENKFSLPLYAGGAILAFWISLVIVRALDSVPLLPGILELVGLGYSGWFVYRYLLFQENRKELADNLDAIKKRITGDDE